MQTVYWKELSEAKKCQILQRNVSITDEKLVITVKDIVANVKARGDKSLYEYAKKFDKVELNNLLVGEHEYAVIDKLTSEEKEAIKTAIKNIRTYHEMCVPKCFEYEKNGINLGKLYRPIEKVGLYIPGGTAPLVSTVMMLAIPAAIAKCKTKILVTPPREDGTIAPAILFAAGECGIETIYKVGGAQAIAALAFGTETIPKVHKIFGPGNKYVTEAKIIVSGCHDGAAIDMPAGASEVLVIGDENANAKYIASDLLAQAEHDIAAQVVFVTTKKELVKTVLDEIKLQTECLPRKHVIEQSLEKSVIIIADSLDECFMISNIYAPEHLILHLDNAKDYLPKVMNAGSIFIGQFSPESVGDYASGTNHVLPTYGYANMYSGLDVSHFMKSISYQELSRSGLENIGTTVMNLAKLEGLDAHRNAVAIRLK